MIGTLLSLIKVNDYILSRADTLVFAFQFIELCFENLSIPVVPVYVMRSLSIHGVMLICSCPVFTQI